MKTTLAILTCFLLTTLILNGQSKVRLYGTVSDFIGKPVDSASVWLKQNIDSLKLADKGQIFKNSYETFTDSKGNFSIDVVPGTYYCLYAIKEIDYGKTKLEYWAWNLPIYHDLEINPKYDRLEVYAINAFEPQKGPFNTYMVYFRPMSLTKALKLPKKLTTDTINIAPNTITTDELSVAVNGHPAKVLTIDKMREYNRNGRYMYSYMLQILKPDDALASPITTELASGFDKISIILHSKETDEYGMGEYFIKKIGD